jgi:hypothetical protein
MHLQRYLEKTLALAALALAGFCAFGLLATLEPNPPAWQWTWRGIYSVLGAACLWGSARLWRGRREKRGVKSAKGGP